MIRSSTILSALPPLAHVLEMEKGETIEWILQDKFTIIMKRHTEENHHE